MAYKIKRSKVYTDTLELCDSSGNVEKRLEIEIDVDAAARDFRKLIVATGEAEANLKKAQSKGAVEFEDAYIAYGEAIIALFQLVFGIKNTDELLKYYENRYTEMSLQLIPYINSIVIPLMGEAVKRKKRELRRLNRR